MMSKPFSIKERVYSFRYALAGLQTLLREEHNARIHLVVAILVTALATVLGASRVDWILLSIVMALVFICEAFNSAVEYLCDLVTTETHPLIRKAKDVSAAAVLISATMAAVVGLLVFIPLLIE